VIQGPEVHPLLQCLSVCAERSLHFPFQVLSIFAARALLFPFQQHACPRMSPQCPASRALQQTPAFYNTARAPEATSPFFSWRQPCFVTSLP
jgi:hypothetical protein